MSGQKIAIITGAGSGIGRAAAHALADHGAAVTCADLDLPAAEKTAASITDRGGNATACALDVTSETQWVEAIRQLVAAHGRLDIAIHSAGVSAAGPMETTTLDEWRRILAVNLDGTFLGTREAVRVMRRQGSGGCIVNVASVSGVKAQPGAAAYCASKAAVIHFTRAAALECLRAKDSIRINSISPGAVKTELWKTMSFFQELMRRHGGEEGAFAAVAAHAPFARWALPEEVARGILYLACDDSAPLTGTNLIFENGDSA